MNFIACLLACRSVSTGYPRPRGGMRSATGLGGEARAFERGDAPIGLRAELGAEGLESLERALDRGASGAGLRGQQAKARPRDVESAEPPASPPIDEPTPLAQGRGGGGPPGPGGEAPPARRRRRRAASPAPDRRADPPRTGGRRLSRSRRRR